METEEDGGNEAVSVAEDEEEGEGGEEGEAVDGAAEVEAGERASEDGNDWVRGETAASSSSATSSLRDAEKSKKERRLFFNG